MRVFEQQLLELCVDEGPRFVLVVRSRKADPIAALDRDEHHEVEPLQGLAQSGQKVLELERIRLLVAREVSEKVHGAALEEHVLACLVQVRDRALELGDEVLDGRRVRELVALLLQRRVGLVHDLVARQPLGECLEQRGFAGSVAA